MTFKHELYLKIDTENVKLNIDAPKKITLKAELKDLPEKSNGLEYLGGSPYGGTKSMTVLPSDNPEVINIKIPVRNLNSPLILPEGNGENHGNVTCKVPSRTFSLDAEVGDTAWTESYGDTSKYISWPPMGDGSTGVHLNDFLEENLYSEIAYICLVDYYYPGYIKAFTTATHLEMDVAATVNKSGLIWDLALMAAQGGYVPKPEVTVNNRRLFTAYSIPLFVYSDQMLAFEQTYPLFDCRSTFFDAIENSEHPFMQYLKRCRSANPLIASVLNEISGYVITEDNGYSAKFAVLMFLTEVNIPELSLDVICNVYSAIQLAGELIEVKRTPYTIINGKKAIKLIASEYEYFEGFNSILYNTKMPEYYKITAYPNSTDLAAEHFDVITHVDDSDDSSGRLVTFDDYQDVMMLVIYLEA